MWLHFVCNALQRATFILSYSMTYIEIVMKVQETIEIVETVLQKNGV